MSDMDQHPGSSIDELDPANQSLADALRKSFWALKLLMIVLVILYLLSGWFSVGPDEVGFRLRFGRVLGTGPGGNTAMATLEPGWHWSWPYPLDQSEKVPTKERELPVEFLYELSEQERTSGKLEIKFNNFLNPERDDFLITGDLNILHGKLMVKYRITDPVAYITHVHPEPLSDDPRAQVYETYKEATVMTNLVRSAVIGVAARSEALDIRGAGQEVFLQRVGQRVNERLDALAAAGTPLGISVDKDTGIISAKIANVEAIFPPRQVQQEFDRVFSVQTEKGTVIAEARKAATAILTQTAGPSHGAIGAAIGEEFKALLELSGAESSDSAESTVLASLRADLDRERDNVERLLDGASGLVQATINDSQAVYDRLVQETAADHARLERLLPEYRRNPGIFLSRMRHDVYAAALSLASVNKTYLPKDAKEFRLIIARGRKRPTEQATDEAGTPPERITIGQLMREGKITPSVRMQISR